MDVGTDAAAAFLITGGFVYFGMSSLAAFSRCFVKVLTAYWARSCCASACSDSTGKVVGSKAIIVTKRNGKTVVSKHERHVLQYGDPQSLTAEIVANIGRRWQPNTLAFVLERESTHYAWYGDTSVPLRRNFLIIFTCLALDLPGLLLSRLVPGEVPGVNHGGLAYRFTPESSIPARVFPVVSSVQPR